MPVRSLTSSVLRWPDAKLVDDAVRRWTRQMVLRKPETLRIGYFGSYARGDWGVGSDLDLIVVVERADEPFEKRSLAWDTSDLPVAADVLVYTETEWGVLLTKVGFARSVDREAIWVYKKA